MAKKNNQTAGQAAQAQVAATAQPGAAQPTSTPESTPGAHTSADDSAHDGEPEDDEDESDDEPEENESADDEEVVSLRDQVQQLEADLANERTRSGELAGELNDQAQELVEAQTLIEELQQKLATANAGLAEGNVTIVSDGTSDYRLLAPKFHYKHQLYTGEELKTNPQLVAELVAAEVGYLVKLEAKQ